MTLIVNRGGEIDTVLKTAYIQVGPVVNINALPNDTAYADQTITLDATTTGATYLWYPGLQTTPTITVDTTGLGLGVHTFYCTVNTPDGCVQTPSRKIWFLLPTGIADKTHDLNAVIFPNPNSGTFALDISSARNELVNLKIINALNATIYEENGIYIKQNLHKNFSLNSLRPGMYFLILQNSDTRIVQKFFVN